MARIRLSGLSVSIVFVFMQCIPLGYSGGNQAIATAKNLIAEKKVAAVNASLPASKASAIAQKVSEDQAASD